MTRTRTLLALLLLVASCGGGDTSSTTTVAEGTTTLPQTTLAPTTTAGTAVTTTLPPTPSTTTTAATTTTAPVIVYAVADGVPPVLGASGDPHGSGCAPPAGDVLPDGIWFGFVRAFDGFGGGDFANVHLDLACYFTGTAAFNARVADGLSGDSDASEYVRNKSPKIYQLPLSRGAEVWWLPGVGFPDLIPANEWPKPGGYFTCPGDFCPVWIYVNGGIITGLYEMFFE